MQVSDIIASLALLVSLASAGFSWWSAKEAAHTRKITRSQELAPHFINVGYLWDLVLGLGGSMADIKSGNLSLKFLQSQLSGDQAFMGCLKNLPEWAEEANAAHIMVLGGEEYKIPSDAAAAKEIFERKQREYLSIG